MFEQLRQIDTAFRHIKRFTLVMVSACVLVSGFALYRGYALSEQAADTIYILHNGKVLEASRSSRRENIPVEARDHVRTFHDLFFGLDPDEESIRERLSRALYLADASAKQHYDNLRESGYYARMVSSNISQTIEADSIRIDTGHYPYRFTYTGTQHITRRTSVTIRRLVTQGTLRHTARTDQNPHGLLIEEWATLENHTVNTLKRK
ncbi:conjugative transposon protein TraK [Roseivirga sp. BDSF3-8]|uniref:conjugative transposon protein TraK n=1 Tax=Roseivirga sp. BDSF3-8 TaxID=3241598 RepID=UPI00353277F6